MATTTLPGGFRPRAVRSQDSRESMAMADRQAYLSRWLKVWVALATVVVLVVVVYLIFISNALAGINSGLAVAQRAVTGAGSHTKTLPSQVKGINTSLAAIDTALKPIPGQANTIVSNLTTIEGHLGSIDTSLKSTSPMLVTVAGSLVSTTGALNTITGNLNQTAPTLVHIASTLVGVTGSLGNTSGSLVNTSQMLTGITNNLNGISSSLVDTSGILRQVLGTANSINGTLIAANVPAGNCSAPETNGTYTPPPGTVVGAFSCGTNQLGVQNIHQRVSIADNVLAPAQGDLTNITSGLTSVDGHLISACKGTVVQLLAALHGGAGC